MSDRLRITYEHCLREMKPLSIRIPNSIGFTEVIAAPTAVALSSES
jgi:hypothetical protein